WLAIRQPSGYTSLPVRGHAHFWSGELVLIHHRGRQWLYARLAPDWGMAHALPRAGAYDGRHDGLAAHRERRRECDVPLALRPAVPDDATQHRYAAAANWHGTEDGKREHRGFPVQPQP